jgi:hypothetical protein
MMEAVSCIKKAHVVFRGLLNTVAEKIPFSSGKEGVFNSPNRYYILKEEPPERIQSPPASVFGLERIFARGVPPDTAGSVTASV